MLVFITDYGMVVEGRGKVGMVRSGQDLPSMRTIGGTVIATFTTVIASETYGPSAGRVLPRIWLL